MYMKLSRLITGAILITLPMLVGCGGGSKSSYPEEFAPPPKTQPVGMGGSGDPGLKEAPIPTK